MSGSFMSSIGIESIYPQANKEKEMQMLQNGSI